MLEKGYIKLYRSMLDWEWYRDSNTFRVFMHLLLTVNHYDQKWYGITIERGSRVVSIRKLASELGLSVRQVRTAIQHLEATHDITQRATQLHGSKISVFSIEKRWLKFLSDTATNTARDTTPTQQPTQQPTQPQYTENDAITAKKGDCAERTNTASDTANGTKVRINIREADFDLKSGRIEPPGLLKSGKIFEGGTGGDW